MADDDTNFTGVVEPRESSRCRFAPDPPPPDAPLMLQGAQYDTPPARVMARGPLAGSRFLASFHEAGDRLALESVAQPLRSHPSGTDLVREGDTTDSLLVLTEGWACRYKTTRDGSRQIVALIVPGEVANLDTLMFGRPDFSVRSLTPVKTVAIACEDALVLADTHPGIGRTLTRPGHVRA
jgi:CRP-like cAMP-binding protein